MNHYALFEGPRMKPLSYYQQIVRIPNRADKLDSSMLLLHIIPLVQARNRHISIGGRAKHKEQEILWS
jgi:hypothetical protein